MVEIRQTPPFKFQFPYSHFSFTSSLPLQKTMLLRLPSPPLSSSFLSTTTPKHLRLFSSSSSPRPRPRRRRSLFRCAAGNDVVEVDAFTNKSGYLFELSNSDANSIEDYDISKIGAIYRRRPLILLRRLFQTGLTFGKWFAFRYIDNLMERSDQMFKVRAEELRQVLLQLGPAYIKIAQAISSRPGQKLSEVNDLYMVEVGTPCSFNQLLEYGFYHADPHPGNLLCTYDGKLAYLDFGMMGEFKQELRNGFIEACLHLVNHNFGALAKDFVTLGLIPPTADKEAVTKALTGVFQNAVAKGVRNISFGDLLGDLGTTMYKFKFRSPSYFSLVI